MNPVRAFPIAAILLAAPSAAAAQVTHFNVPAGRLGDALAHLGRQARVTIGLTDQQLQVQRVRALRGRMTVEQALAALLRGTHGRVERIDDVTFRVVRFVPLPPFKPTQRKAERAPSNAAFPPTIVTAEDIVVVGSRRHSPLSDYPGGVTIVSGNDPDFPGVAPGTEALVHRLADVTTTHLGPGRNKIFIRGMSDSGVNGSTQSTVGQYFGDFRVNYNAPDPNLRLFDIDRIEVLEGPQGTLYGAGALGGILRVLPASPDPASVSGAVGVGASTTAHGDGGYDLTAALNLPLGKNAAVRASLYRVDEGGYIDDLRRDLDDINRVRTTGGRVAARFLAGEHWTIDGLAVKQRIRGDDSQYGETWLPPLKRYSALAQNFRNDYEMVGLSAFRDGDKRDFTLSVSHTDQELFERFDAVAAIDFPLVAYDLKTRVRMFSAEARLNGRNDAGLSWVLGAAAFANESTQKRYVDFIPLKYLRNAVSNDAVDLALFGEAQFPVARNTSLTLGGRLMRVDSRGEGLVALPGTKQKPVLTEVTRSQFRALPTIALSTKPAHDLLVYARYQEGYRPGGVNVSLFGVGRFDGDRLRVVEAGMRKGRQNGGPIDLAFAAGYADWRDVQGDTLDLTAEQTTINIGDARNLFADASLAWRPVRGLQIDGGLLLIDSEITSGPSRGFPLPGVAKVNARAGAGYGFSPVPGVRSRIGISGRYTGESYLDTGITSPGYEELLRRKQGDWLDVALYGHIAFGRVTATLDATNLLDSTASRFAMGTPLLLGQREFTTPLRPRTIRLGIDIALGN